MFDTHTTDNVPRVSLAAALVALTTGDVDERLDCVVSGARGR